jgi:hypothetical protein
MNFTFEDRTQLIEHIPRTQVERPRSTAASGQADSDIAKLES